MEDTAGTPRNASYLVQPPSWVVRRLASLVQPPVPFFLRDVEPRIIEFDFRDGLVRRENAQALDTRAQRVRDERPDARLQARRDRHGLHGLDDQRGDGHAELCAFVKHMCNSTPEVSEVSDAGRAAEEGEGAQRRAGVWGKGLSGEHGAERHDVAGGLKLTIVRVESGARVTALFCADAINAAGGVHPRIHGKTDAEVEESVHLFEGIFKVMCAEVEGGESERGDVCEWDAMVEIFNPFLP